MDTIMLVYVVAGIVAVLLAIPLIRRVVPPNYFYGFRLPQTLRNPELWYDVNAYGGKWLLAFGVLTIIAAFVFRLVPGFTVDAYAITCTVIILVVLMLMLIMTFRYMSSRPKS